MKYRIVEDDRRHFYPQFKPGLLWRWRFFSADADTSEWMLQRAMETFDPESAALFSSEDAAAAFIERVRAKSKLFWSERAAKERRAAEGIRVKRTMGIKPDA